MSNLIKIGKNTNIQDCSVVHTSRFDGPTNIGSNITIGHMALIHACTIEDNAFIGMQTTVCHEHKEVILGFVRKGTSSHNLDEIIPFSRNYIDQMSSTN